MKRNTDLDFIRAILIVLMILIHIVSFGNAYPQLKAGILSFMMPTFLIITGYLVNIEKTGRQMGNYLKCLALPYVIMVMLPPTKASLRRQRLAARVPRPVTIC